MSARPKTGRKVSLNSGWSLLSLGLLTASGCAQLIGADFDAKTEDPNYFAGAAGMNGEASGGKPSGGKGSGGKGSGGKASDGKGSGGKGSGGKGSGGEAAGGQAGTGGDAGSGDGGASSGGVGGDGTGGQGVGGTAAGPCMVASDCSAVDVVINELSAEGRPDFIELYNAGDKPADLGGFGITDGDLTPDVSHLALLEAGTFLEPGQFLYLQEDERPTVNCTLGEDRCLWFSFGISKSGDTVFLMTPESTIQDSLTYPSDAAAQGLTEDLTWGRFPDGDSNAEPLVPTEKGPNVAAAN